MIGILVALFALSVFVAMIVWMLAEITDKIHDAEVDELWDDDLLDSA